MAFATNWMMAWVAVQKGASDGPGRYGSNNSTIRWLRRGFLVAQKVD